MPAATEIWNGDNLDGAFATGANWVSDTAPVSTGSALFPAMAYVATRSIAGSDQTAKELVKVEVEPQCNLTFGSRAAFLQLDVDYLVFAGSGVGFFRIINSTKITVDATATGGSSAATYGLYLNGTANTELEINGGVVGVAAFDTDSATFTTISINNSPTVDIGPAVTMTTLNVRGGTVYSQSGCATANIAGGTVTHAAGSITTVNIYGGTYKPLGLALPVINQYGGLVDLSGLTGTATGGPINGYAGTISDPNGVLATTPVAVNRKRPGTTTMS